MTQQPIDPPAAEQTATNPTPKTDPKDAALGFLILFGLCYGLFWGCQQLFSGSSSTTTNSSSSVRTVTLKSGYIGTYSEADLDKAISILNSKDEAAYSQMILEGRVEPLKEGTQATISQCLGFACSKVKIRPMGQTTELYTVNEALSK